MKKDINPKLLLLISGIFIILVDLFLYIKGDKRAVSNTYLILFLIFGLLTTIKGAIDLYREKRGLLPVQSKVLDTATKLSGIVLGIFVVVGLFLLISITLLVLHFWVGAF